MGRRPGRQEPDSYLSFSSLFYPLIFYVDDHQQEKREEIRSRSHERCCQNLLTTFHGFMILLFQQRCASLFLYSHWLLWSEAQINKPMNMKNKIKDSKRRQNFQTLEVSEFWIFEFAVFILSNSFSLYFGCFFNCLCMDLTREQNQTLQIILQQMKKEQEMSE